MYYTGSPNPLLLILLHLYKTYVYFKKTYLVCKDQVHSHPVLESVECPDGNEPPSPTKKTQHKSYCTVYQS